MGCGVVERHLEMAQPTKKTDRDLNDRGVPLSTFLISRALNGFSTNHEFDHSTYKGHSRVKLIKALPR